MRLLTEYLDNDNRIGVDSIDDAPTRVFIRDPEFMAPWPNNRHGPRMWHPEFLTLLKSPQQEAGLEPGSPREGRRFDLAFEPDERLVSWSHHKQDMSYPAYCQAPILSAFYIGLQLSAGPLLLTAWGPRRRIDQW
jgi:hypothetical protein